MGEHEANSVALQAAESAGLFKILPAAHLAPVPRGMARLAAESTHADDGHLIEFKSMQARSLLNRSTSKRQLSLEWSINPYRGCEFACKYCYARYTHEFLTPAKVETPPVGAYEAPVQAWALAFEREIYLKENAAWLLEQELRKIDPAQEIAIGTATDPYQPVERRVGITRSILEVFARREGYRIGIVTKSNLIARDVDLLTRIAARNTLVVHHTVTTVDVALARKLEPRAPRPDLRLAALRTLRQAGITAGVLCSPLLPGINDTPESVDAVASRAKEAGASFFAGHPLFLKSCSRPTWMSFVREHFPNLAAEYAERFASADFTGPTYRRQMADRIRRACRRHDLAERSTDALLTRDVGSDTTRQPASTRKPPQRIAAPAAATAQMALFG